MKRALRAVLTAVAAVLALAASGQAGGGNENAKILLHLVPTPASGETLCAPALPNCSQIVTHGDPYPSVYYAYVLVTDVNPDSGLLGVQFGIDYGSGRLDDIGLDIWGWTFCADVEYPQPSPVWPASGGGNLLLWNTCQSTVPSGAQGAVASPGYFYLGSYGNATMHITVRPVDGAAKVANCSMAEDWIEGGFCTGGMVCDPWVYHDPSFLGSIGLGTQQGWNPCGLVDVAVENVTWGKLKSLYRQ